MNYEEFKEKYYAALKDLMDSFGCGMAAEIKASREK